MEFERKNSELLAILFDLDNTLIATRKADAKACKKLSQTLTEKYTIPLETSSQICNSYLKAFRECPDNPDMELDTWREYLWSQALGDQYHTFSESIYQEWLNLRYHFLALTPEITVLLQNLRQHYFVGLITNGPSHAQWEKVERLKLKSFFDIILVSGDLPWEKPHHKIFHEACDYLGVEPHHCIMVGDKLETDILGGIKAQLGGTVWTPLNNCKLQETDPKPDFVIEYVTELPSLLPRIKRVPGFRNNIVRGLNRFTVTDMDDCNSNSSDGS